MNQIKIGKFIKESRNKKNLTQKQLAEKLNITDKAVSKWERGISMPDSSIMIQLCEILSISVNELLIGENIDGDIMNNDDINIRNKKILLDITEELEEKNKIIWKSMWMILLLSIVGLFSTILVISSILPEGISLFIAILLIGIIYLIPLLYSLKLELSVGAYKCKNCSHEFVPTYKQALNAMHLGTTRYLKCPNCNKRTWCKKVL